MVKMSNTEQIKKMNKIGGSETPAAVSGIIKNY
jgi:hypothetical protein